jgi:DHA1 family bicyclomycin/chloramphenicol resistance-like MFS transporter
VFGLAVAFFALFGCLLVSVGSVQHEMARSLSLSLSQTGALGAALSAGLGSGLVLAGPAVDRGYARPVFAGACGLGALSLLSLSTGSAYGHLLLALATAGLGVGAAETVLNAAIAGRRGQRALTLVHAAATAGAVIAPALFALAVERGEWSSGFRGMGAGFACIALVGSWTRLVVDRVPRGEPDPGAPRLPALLPFAIAGAAYVGFELAFTLFLTPYATGALGLGAGRGRSAISVFWLGLLAGRVGLVLLRREAGAAYLMSAGCTAALLLLLGVGLRASAVELWVLGVGMALGGVFPVLIALATARHPEAPGTAAGLVAGAAAGGGFVVPWVAGLVGDASGPAGALAGLGVWCAVLVGAARRMRR